MNAGEQRALRPLLGDVKPNAPGTGGDEGADFPQTLAQGADLGSGYLGQRGRPFPLQHHDGIGDDVFLQPKSVGAETMGRQPVGLQTILQLADGLFGYVPALHVKAVITRCEFSDTLVTMNAGSSPSD